MRELQIVHDALLQHCPELHKKRLDSLMVATKALFASDTPTLTSLGRHVDSQCRVIHSIKRIDRLLSNHHLHIERLAVYRWQVRLLCHGNPMPVALVDWADVREQMRLMVLRASIAIEGRSVTLYERTFTLQKQGSPEAQD